MHELSQNQGDERSPVRVCRRPGTRLQFHQHFRGCSNPLGGYNHYLFAEFIVVSKFFSISSFAVSIYCTQTS